MFTMNVSKIFWSEAIQTAAFLINHFPSSVLNFQTHLNLSSFPFHLFPLPPKTFGYICFVHISKFDRTKLDPEALKCIFLSHVVNQKGYKCYHLACRQHLISQYVTFFESIPFFSM